MYKYNDKIITFINPMDIEPQAVDQIRNISEMPFIYKHIAVMPDCHLGKGACVGSVIATQGAIIPAAVGVDIGCGMIAVRTNLTSQALPDDVNALRVRIERAIPLGAGGNNQKISKSAENRIHQLILSSKPSVDYYDGFAKWKEQLGSLGSGNHFIEVCLDENDVVWIVLHSGSRGIGNRLASRHIKVAQELMDLFHIPLKDKDLAYLPQGTKEFNSYVEDLLWAQEYALLNREEMMDRVMQEFISFLGIGQLEEVERINCHHNFSQMENHFGKNIWITRKGAIQMRKGQKGVIPGSMGTSSYIVSGLENIMAFHSAPHGAGRRFSRNEAKRRFNLQDLKREMKDIEFRESENLIDEIPLAYKPIEEVMENSKELVVIEHTLNQILNVKGD